jgi:hypothetical protein
VTARPGGFHHLGARIGEAGGMQLTDARVTTARVDSFRVPGSGSGDRRG